MTEKSLPSSHHSPPPASPEMLAGIERDARAIRRLFLRMHYENSAGHIGSGLSAIDILAAIHKMWIKNDDRFILSKGHAASSLYATLHHFGILPESTLRTYYRDGTWLPAHPAAGGVEAIPIATGSLGHGLPIATGLAFARRHLDPAVDGGEVPRVACLLSDGECNEGTTWEAALFAAHHRLDNLLVIVDANGLQGFGRTADVLDTEPFGEKWRAFGFDVREIDGHDFAQLHGALALHGEKGAREAAAAGKPRCIIARTIKGKGVTFMENRLEWHYLPLKEEQYRLALAELDGKAAREQSPGEGVDEG